MKITHYSFLKKIKLHLNRAYKMKTLFIQLLLSLLTILNAQHALSQPPGFSKNEDKTLIITLRYSDDRYQVMNASVVNGNIPTKANHHLESGDLSVSFNTKDGEKISESMIENPFILRGILSNIESHEGHQTQVTSESTFVIRAPYQQGVEVMNIIKKENTIQGRSLTPSKPNSHSISLTEHLN